VKATEIFAGICRNLPGHPAKRLLLNQKIFGYIPSQMEDKRKTSGRQKAGSSGGLPSVYPQFFGKASAAAKAFPEENAIFPKLSRTVPEEMGVFPEELPKRAPKKVQYFRPKAGNGTDKFPKHSQTLPGHVCPLSALCLPLDSEDYQLIVRHSPNDWRTELLQMIIADIVNTTDKIAVLLAQRFPDYMFVFTKRIKGPFTNPKNLHRILGTYPISWIIKLCFMQLIH
jgi:hypothetical protein